MNTLYYDVVRDANHANQFYYDFNKNGNIETGEVFTIEVNDSSDQINQDVAIIQRVVKGLEANDYKVSCFDRFAESADTIIDKLNSNAYAVRYYDSPNAYKNISNYLHIDWLDAYRGFNSDQVQLARQSIQKNIEEYTSKLERIVQDYHLKPTHPFTLLLNDLRVYREVLDTVRLKLQSDEDQADGTFNSSTRILTISYIDADTRDFDTVEEYTFDLVFPAIIHELDHAAMLTPGYFMDDWVERKYMVIGPKDKICMQKWELEEGQKFRDDSGVNTDITFQMDFVRDGNPTQYTYSSEIQRYWHYPVSMNDKKTCMPLGYVENQTALEAKAYLATGRMLLLMNFEQYGLTLEELLLMLENDPQNADQVEKIKDKIDDYVIRTLKELEGEPVFIPGLTHLLSYIGRATLEETGQEKSDITDYVRFAYAENHSIPTENRENCNVVRIPE